MTAYNSALLGHHVDRGAMLIKAIEGVQHHAPQTLDQAIGLLIACINGTYDTEEDIEYIWEAQGSAYSLDACRWLLAKFEGSDPETDLWMRTSNGRYTLLDPAVAKPKK